VLTLLGGAAALLATRPALAEEEGGAVGEGEGEASVPAVPGLETPAGYKRHFGRATSASSYGGYGGKDDFFKYTFLYPESWKTTTVSKTMKATNGTDVRYADPNSKKNVVYAVSFAGQSYASLKEDRRSIVNDLALSDSGIQDALTFADDVVVGERVVDDVKIADFDIVTGNEAIYLAVTCDGSRLYGLFVLGGSPAPDDPARTIRNSLRALLKNQSARTGAGI
jgi:hypothetical protein